MVILEVIKAKKGDCLLFRYGEDQERLSLIDGGPGGVWKSYLQPRLEALRAQRGGEDRLRLDMLMVSHIDDDHINGLIQMTDHLAGQAGTADILLDAQVVWHNSFEDVFGEAGATLVTGGLSSDVESASTAMMSTYSISNESALLLASVGQGQAFRNNVVDGLGWPLNSPFDGLVMVRPTPIEIPGGLTLTVLGPDQERLAAFRKAWDEELKKKADKAATAAYLDKSAWNLASIVVLVEVEGRRLLLTGDGRGDHIIQNAKALDLPDSEGKVQLDVLKLPHHGSTNNLDPDFFDMFQAKSYVISGDGSHGNPRVEAFDMLLGSRSPEDEHCDLFLTYDPADYKAHNGEAYPLAELQRVFDEHRSAGKDFSVIWPDEEDALFVTVPVGERPVA